MQLSKGGGGPFGFLGVAKQQSAHYQVAFTG
jgi:hypothetical protein